MGMSCRKDLDEYVRICYCDKQAPNFSGLNGKVNAFLSGSLLKSDDSAGQLSSMQ